MTTIQFKHGLSKNLVGTQDQSNDTIQKEITLRGRGKTEVYCEITDKLNEYNLYTNSASKLYMCIHSKNCIVIRGEGASRGCIKYDDNHIITEIRLYQDCDNFGDQGMFKPEHERIITDELNKFIGYKIK